MEKIMSVSELQRNAFGVVRNVASGGKPVIIVQNSRPAAVLIGHAEFEELLATLEVLSNPELVNSIETSVKQIKEKEYLRAEILKEDLNE